MKKTSEKRLKWLLSDKPKKLRKKIEQIKKIFIQMIEETKTQIK